MEDRQSRGVWMLVIRLANLPMHSIPPLISDVIVGRQFEEDALADRTTERLILRLDDEFFRSWTNSERKYNDGTRSYLLCPPKWRPLRNSIRTIRDTSPYSKNRYAPRRNTTTCFKLTYVTILLFFCYAYIHLCFHLLSSRSPRIQRFSKFYKYIPK